ncbi:fibrobacter succinogenes major paralogous domain-containing protein [Bacteroidales bacterium OttesenSCG-928-B11]|nr:fibrobacter succinogenes major paralogous domain-containing protein [Bacteroidales bacterium OttesenSCG-928-B11]
MKKIILILTFFLSAFFLSFGQDTIRSLRIGEWGITLEEGVTYTIESNDNALIINSTDTTLRTFSLPERLLFSSIGEDFEKGVVIDGVKWATRNLAAHGQFVENPEDYGALFQWGRIGDGHEQRTSPNYPTDDNSGENGAVSGAENFDAHGQVDSTHEAYGKFIKQLYPIGSCDWRIPKDADLWNSGSAFLPEKTVNDPCPAGWRLPSRAEFQKLIQIGERTDEPAGFACTGDDGTSSLFFPATGSRRPFTGLIEDGITYGEGSYWSNAADQGSGLGFLFSNTGSYTITGHQCQATGLSIRCVADIE